MTVLRADYTPPLLPSRNDEDLLPGWLGTDNEPNIIRPDNLKDRMSKMKASSDAALTAKTVIAAVGGMDESSRLNSD